VLRAILLALLLLLRAPVDAAETQTILIGYLGEERQPGSPRGLLDEVVTGAGLQGARLAVADNNTTGRFLGQQYRLVESPAGLAPAAAIAALAEQGVRFVVADLHADMLLLAADAPEASEIVMFNARASDDELRSKDCRRNVLHIIPSRAMLADGLAQYLIWKRWPRWFLLTGPAPGDRALAVAIKRAAARFGAKIAAERDWTFLPANGRADTGHVTLQTEIPAATQVGDYDVLVVADERDEFGAYLDGRTALPRPVAGTHGLIATGWSPVIQEWGAMQLQSRFRRKAGRGMTVFDYAAWVAVRSIGEAASRLRSTDPQAIGSYIRGDDFLLAGFKGQGLSFRPWNGQLRQPILIAGPRLLVSASPQPGFLHQRTPLDTLGIDLEESECRI
jgi:ABC transporter substrate binding protein (PQQ-dependent alcohol dehydrogenase system)